MPIPADISELRTRFKREQDTTAAQFRERAGVAEPEVQDEGSTDGEDC